MNRFDVDGKIVYAECCPFCGESLILVPKNRYSDVRWLVHPENDCYLAFEAHEDEPVSVCVTEGASVPYRTLEAWNRRHAQPPQEG